MKKIVWVLIMVLWLSSIFGSFVLGQKITQHQEPLNVATICTVRNTEIRESPTGYIIIRIARGSELWVREMDAPFAYVSYFDGEQWIEGSVTASYLGRCDISIESES